MQYAASAPVSSASSGAKPASDPAHPAQSLADRLIPGSPALAVYSPTSFPPAEMTLAAQIPRSRRPISDGSGHNSRAHKLVPANGALATRRDNRPAAAVPPAA